MAAVIVLLCEFAEMWSGLNPWLNDSGFAWVLQNLTMGIKTTCQAPLGESAAGFPQHLRPPIPSTVLPKAGTFCFCVNLSFVEKKKKKTEKKRKCNNWFVLCLHSWPQMALILSRVRRLHPPWNIQRDCYRLWWQLLKEIQDYFYSGAKDVLKTSQGKTLTVMKRSKPRDMKSLTQGP